MRILINANADFGNEARQNKNYSGLLKFIGSDKRIKQIYKYKNRNDGSNYIT